jgi:phosphopentomutase
LSEPDVPDRVILIVFDSVGCGELPDAGDYGDTGSDTLGNISRRIPLSVPNLRRLGLTRVSTVARLGSEPDPVGGFGRMAESSPGKDSVTGHWELTGLVLERAFPVFPSGFPRELMDEFERRIGRGTLGNKAASGTVILDELGPEHMDTGKPIVYTSADSVFQIAAHEDVVPLAELYRWCEIGYELAGKGMGIGRVIARPFIGSPGAFRRTANRRDFALTPPQRTLLDHIKDAGLPVVAIGKIEDLFAGRGVTSATHTANDDQGIDEVLRAMQTTKRGLIFANLVDFDTQYGHRNDVAGYAANLERMDARVGEVMNQLGPRDLLVVTADHGNDPTTPSTDHAREYVPVFLTGPAIRAGVDLGTRATFADLGQTIAELFAVGPLDHGASFLASILVHKEQTGEEREDKPALD